MKQTHKLTSRIHLTPPQDFYARPELHILCGKTVQIENCKKVAAYTPDCLRVNTGKWQLILSGTKLRIRSLAGNRLLLEGNIMRIEFEMLQRGGE